MGGESKDGEKKGEDLPLTSLSKYSFLLERLGEYLKYSVHLFMFSLSLYYRSRSQDIYHYSDSF